MKCEYDEMFIEIYKHLKDKDIYSTESYHYIKKQINDFLKTFHIDKKRLMLYLKGKTCDYDICSVIAHSSICITIILSLITIIFKCNLNELAVWMYIISCLILVMLIVKMIIFLNNSFNIKKKIIIIMMSIAEKY